ncbi:MAG: hypothetical protein K2X93_19050 [Candidatus Obscuribacterales bacterium]|nr:hypothetical protein [Candidatus Obscuribacterales bacterium]
MTAPTPSTCFYIQCCGERTELLRVVYEIKKCYPTSRIIICFDGDRDDKSALALLRSEPNVDMVEGEQLYRVEHGGAVCHRMLQLFLEKPADFLIKVDPDTRVVKPFSFWPTVDRYFGGTIVMSGESISIQGGCMIFSRQLCLELYESGILLSDELKPPTSAWVGSAPTRYRAQVLGLTSHDWTIAYAIARLGVEVSWHPQVLSRWESLRLRDIPSYYSAAVIHPYTEGVLGVLSLKNLLRKVRNEKVNDYGPVSMDRQFSFKASSLSGQSLLDAVMLWLLNTVDATGSVRVVDSPRITMDLSDFFRECLSSSTTDVDSQIGTTDVVVFGARKIRSASGASNYVRRAMPYAKGSKAIIVDIANEPTMLLFALLIIIYLGKFNFKFFFRNNRMMVTFKDGWPDRRTILRGFFSLPVAAIDVFKNLAKERPRLNQRH